MINKSHKDIKNIKENTKSRNPLEFGKRTVKLKNFFDKVYKPWLQR
ncbi:hypothetical protein ADU37_CDS14640 [Thermococcus sp. 2319x1]|nr:hypothetical protein ADU37_CDS14640 [Thermococcus sp. 2319x1]